MNSSVLLRLYWKEFRQLWQLWTCIVVAGIAFQTLPLLLQMVWSGSLYSDRSDYLSFVVMLTLVLTACIGLVSAALLFAGESEEGTANRTRLLPLSTMKFVVGKLSFSLLATGLSFLCLALSAALCWGVVNGGRFQIPTTEVFPLQTQFSNYGTSIIALWALGVMYSVFLNRVFQVLLLSLMTEILLLVQLQDVLYVHDLFMGLLILFDIGFVVLWYRRPLTLDWSSIPISVERLSLRKLQISRFLRWAAHRGDQSRRLNGVLIWKELRTLIPVALTLLILGIISLIMLSRHKDHQYLSFFFFVLLPTICGLLTFRNEQTGECYRFLSDRGCSGWRVWGIKNMLWLGTLFVIGIPLFIVQEYLNMSMKNWSYLGSLQYMSDASFRTIEVKNWSADNLDAIPLVMLIALLLYAFGQWVSFMIQRALYAFSLDLLGTIFLMISIPYTIEYGLPPGQIWGLCIPLWMGATLMSSRGWHDGWKSWRWTAFRVASLFIPILISLSVAYGARVWQIPWQDPGFDVAKWEAEFEDFDTQWSQQYQELSPNPITQMDIHELPYDDVSESNLPVVNKLLEMQKTMPWDRGIDPQLSSPFTTQPLFSPPYLLVVQGRQYRSEGKLESAWDCYFAAIEYARFGRKFENRTHMAVYLANLQMVALTEIRAWSAEPELNDELLAQAVETLTKFPYWDDSFASVIKNEHVAWNQILQQRGLLGKTIDKMQRSDKSLSPLSDQLLIRATWGERQRAVRIINHQTHAQINTLGGDSEIQQNLKEWHRHSPIRFYSHDIGLSERSWKNVTAATRGTLLALKCQQYRRKHKTWPPSLEELDVRTVDLIDPWSNAEFGYTPKGLTQQIDDWEQHKIPAEQPLIWSSPNHPHFKLKSKSEKTAFPVNPECMQFSVL